MLSLGRTDGNSDVLNNYPDKFTVKYCAQMCGKEGGRGIDFRFVASMIRKWYLRITKRSEKGKYNASHGPKICARYVPIIWHPYFWNKEDFLVYEKNYFYNFQFAVLNNDLLLFY